MRTTLLAVTLTALSFIWLPATASAQEERVARGIVSDIGGTFVTVKVGGESMTFGADRKTQVESRGAGTKARQITANGKPGPHLSDVLKVGQSVAVTYGTRLESRTPRSSGRFHTRATSAVPSRRRPNCDPPAP